MKAKTVRRLVHSVPSVAELLDCSDATVWRMIAKGQLRVVRMGPGGGLTRVRDEDVQALIREAEAQ